jgi:hypothetical protein
VSHSHTHEAAPSDSARRPEGTAGPVTSV